MVTPRTRPYDVDARAILDNPSQEELRALTAEMPNARPTALGNVDVFTRGDSRSAGSTYIVTDDPASFRGLQTMSRAEYTTLASTQDAYIAGQEEHHKTTDFNAELRKLVERYGLTWREEENR